MYLFSHSKLYLSWLTLWFYLGFMLAIKNNEVIANCTATETRTIINTNQVFLLNAPAITPLKTGGNTQIYSYNLAPII